MSTKTNMSQMIFRGTTGGVRSAPLPVPSQVSKAPTPPVLRRRGGRAPLISLGSIMTHNCTPCRSCGH
jgi:hypothetical protein